MLIVIRALFIDGSGGKRPVAILFQVTLAYERHTGIALDHVTPTKRSAVSAFMTDRQSPRSPGQWPLRGRSGTKPGTRFGRIESSPAPA